MKTVEVRRKDGSLLCRAGLADNMLTRGIGLLGRKSLAEDEGLIIDPCTSVHTWFMRFPIDVLYLDRDNVVVKTASMPTFRFSLGGKGAKKVLELSKDSIRKHAIAPGDQLTFHEVD